MKELLKWVFPAFLGIVPALGTQEAGIIEDPFFTKPGVACSISRVVESGPKLMAQVTATDDENTKIKLVEALCATVGWQNHDDRLYAQEIVKAQVICGSEFLEKEHTKALQVPYTLLKETEGRSLQGIPMKDSDSLPIGQRVQVGKLLEYQRPDKTTFVKAGETLYELLLEETRTPSADLRHCQREWQEISRFKKITRHQVQTYTRTDVTRTTYRLSLGIDEKIELSKSMIPELKPKAGGYEGEVPTCGEKILPANYKIVS
jgi:hypothetical protein